MFQFNLNYNSFEDWCWQKTVDYLVRWKLQTKLFWRHTNIASWIWDKAKDLANIFFSISVSKEDQKQLSFIWQEV